MAHTPPICLSDIRTTRDMASTASSCSDCLLECSDPACRGLTSLCTDQCRVVPCTDPHAEPCQVVICDNQSCSDLPECTVIEDFIQCCDEYHAYFSNQEPLLDLSQQSFAWDPALEAMFHSDVQAPKPAPTALESYQEPNPSFYSLNAPQQTTLGHRCMWGGCDGIEPSVEALILHVNLHHLRSLSSSEVQVVPQQQSDLSNMFSCHWGDCQAYPNPASVPGSSSNPIDAAIGVLTNHLYQDHFGLQGCTAPTTIPSAPAEDIVVQNPPTPPADHDCCSTSVHPCKWKGCAESFAACESLMEHINTCHVGGGKNHYDCYWDDCGRNGDNGFPSKQKICRHIQSHTGHRPYQCKICNQNFSEAATLQQHMRRHTQEKPYLCDFPGCGKAFAITGALTIHQRIHNGIKPFKCTYCDKAFSESSNLSKHLRTHTGARPYVCPEPGCGKAFARVDQLTRHSAGVHKKKSKGAAPLEPAVQWTRVL